jgi:ribonuclease-3
VVDRLYAGRWPECVEPESRKDFKSRLQEATQRLLRVLPVYALTGSAGPEHDKLFTVAVCVPDGRSWTGQGSSVRHAEHEAARKALVALLDLSPEESKEEAKPEDPERELDPS